MPTVKCNDVSELDDVVQLYYDDLPDPSTLPQELYRWKVFSPSGANLVSIQKIEVLVDAGLTEIPDDLEYLFVVAGPNAHSYTDRKIFRWLNNVANRNVAIGGISSGTYKGMRGYFKSKIRTSFSA